MKQHTGSPERQEPAEYDFQGTGYFDGIPSFPVQNDTGRENAKQHRALQQPAPRPRKRSRRSLTPEEAASLAPLDEALQQQQQPSRKTTPKRRKGKGHEEGEGAGGASPPVPPYPKPDVSFYVLIKEAILSSPEQRLLLCEIYDAIQARYPYFKTAGDGWKNSIRHNLSIKRTFYKEAPEAKEPGGHVPKKGAYWRVARETLLEDYAAEMKAAAIAGSGRRRGSTGSVNIVSPYASYLSLGLPTHGSLMSRPSISAYTAFPLGIRPALFPLRPPAPIGILPVPSLHDIGRRHSTRSVSSASASSSEPPFTRITPNRPRPMFMTEPKIAEASESVYTKIEPLPIETEARVEMNDGINSINSPRMDLYIDWTGEGREGSPKAADSSIPVAAGPAPPIADLLTATQTPAPLPPPDLEKGETYEGPTKHRQHIKEVWFGAPQTLQETDL